MMSNWKAVVGVLFTVSLLMMADCQQEEEPPKPPPPDALTACRSECRAASEKMFQECSDRKTANQEFDSMTECNTQADDFSKSCRAECDAKVAAGS
jgi:hypothetical protein